MRHSYKTGTLVFYETDERFHAEADGEPVEVLVERRVPITDIKIEIEVTQQHRLDAKRLTEGLKRDISRIVAAKKGKR